MAKLPMTELGEEQVHLLFPDISMQSTCGVVPIHNVEQVPRDLHAANQTRCNRTIASNPRPEDCSVRKEASDPSKHEETWH